MLIERYVSPTAVKCLQHLHNLTGDVLIALQIIMQRRIREFLRRQMIPQIQIAQLMLLRERRQRSSEPIIHGAFIV